MPELLQRVQTGLSRGGRPVIEKGEDMCVCPCEGEFASNLRSGSHYDAIGIAQTFDDDLDEVCAVRTSSDPLDDEPTHMWIRE